MTVLHFHIDASEPASRTALVTLELPRQALIRDAVDEAEPEPSSVAELFLATWTPGSYLQREYSRHLSRVTAADADSGEALPCWKTTKNRFAVELRSHTARVRLTYRVYAHELTVRTADLSDSHAYWNNACFLLWPVDRPELPCTLQVNMPLDWDAASSLEECDRHAGMITWRARDLDHAIDSPCLIGKLEQIEFAVNGVPHAAVLEGLSGIEPPATLAADLRAIVEAAAAVFGGDLPYPDYRFLCLFTDDGHGGLEHRTSCTLLAQRTVFSDPKAYRGFLSLCAHELFHAWNVKRLRPAELWSYDYERENLTSFLWLAEGWTAYYDDLLCLRAGHSTAAEYLQQTVTKNIERMLSAAGRHKLSLAESSFDAWIRLYRPDENTRNSSQNYYVNGAVAAMCLDLMIRSETDGERSLDDVLRHLFEQTFGAGRGYVLDDVVAALHEVAGERPVALMQSMVQGPLDPPLEALLGGFGIRLEQDRQDKPFLGVTFKPDSTRIATVQDDTPAARGDMHPDDEILALRGLRVTSDSWQDVFAAVAHLQEPLEVLVSRRGVIQTLSVTPTANRSSVVLRIDENCDPGCERLRRDWLRSSS
ncbi:MAG: M61 family metallopeptidase [Planctomycetes bacterium]|nr:M61 family metallopeptidase [Planctomycetota bacterium]